MINLLDDAINHPSKFRTSNLVKIYDDSKGRYDHIKIRFKPSMTRSILCDYSDAHILVK